MTDFYIDPTGDPFADVGGIVIKYLREQPPYDGKNILELIEAVAKIYVSHWDGKLHAFFLNSTITQPAFKGQRKIDETVKFYKSLLDETAPSQEGFCRISGRQTKLFAAGRDNHILSGSGTFVNFHHNFDAGLLLSKEILIRMFFVPLGLMQLSDKVAMVTSNYRKVTAFFVTENCKKNLQAVTSGIANGVLKSEFNNPANALFALAHTYINTHLRKLLISGDEDSLFNASNVTLNLYHFTNFGASPEVNLYILGAPIFKFYAFCNRLFVKDGWNKFIRSYYHNSKHKNARYNETEEIWEEKESAIGFEEYQTWRNPVLENLLYDKSILGYILKWTAKHSFPFVIVEKYQTIIRNMEKKTIDKIKQIADFIVQDRPTDFITKSIKRLNGEKNPQGLRQFFIKLVSENYQNNASEPLISVADYADYLFPDGGNWREVRDVLLIAIYEKLHEFDKTVEIPEMEEIEEIETTNFN
ncbi:type I-B CRISPR-associated protein Cas8b1/Cst1 [Haoranjiania flava]|uniref:Type I-B CRISPR-associated protein Cas8b1/Cst1 n=2 Tax=Haoranjiania flava TaxID=1856322 RepID=A0AAE3LK62_9BACT|nr:type I-B CRISPR-associated protein Cas8b1/Cst1 [Haoranjiania flava]MCU7694497.1 type I-B CRISPR-associated protein Cas8b1/Cst1 [Haoranjiania flava]